MIIHHAEVRGEFRRLRAFPQLSKAGLHQLFGVETTTIGAGHESLWTPRGTANLLPMTIVTCSPCRPAIRGGLHENLPKCQPKCKLRPVTWR